MDPPPRVHGSLDEPAVGERVDGERLRLRGWVFDERGPLDRVIVVIGDLPPVRLSVGQWRGDVASSFPQFPAAGACGFQYDVDVRAVSPGRLPVELLARTTDGQWHHAASSAIEVAAPPLVTGRRAAAAFTIAQNEPVMLPLWLRYYERHFAAQDLYVLDHDSTDGSTQELTGRCHVIGVHRTTSFDHRWLRTTVEAFQAFLLQSYGSVLFTEVDEFVVPDPRHYSGLADYIARMAAPAARCVGFNVVQQPDEPPLDFDEPILRQRSSWHASPNYCKRLLSRIPLAWSEGFHEEYRAPDDPPDPALMLIHLHRVDYERCLARHHSSAQREWSPEDVVRGDGWQNRVVADEEFDRWFYRGPEEEAPREVIPPHLRDVL